MTERRTKTKSSGTAEDRHWRVGRECACFNVRKLSRAITRAYDQHLTPVDLRITQFTILNSVAVSGAANLNRIAEALVMDRSTLGRNIRPLIKAGLIESLPDEKDGRAQVLQLTTEGKARLAAAMPLWRKAQKELDRKLGATDLLSLVQKWGEIETKLNAT